MNKRGALLEKIIKDGFPERDVFVSVDEFFDGNDDDGSIGANIYPDPPSLHEFYSTLKDLETAAKTDGLFVRITDVDDADWFYSDTIYIFGDYSLAEVQDILKPLKPDEIHDGRMYDKASNISHIVPRNKVYSAWWD